MLFVKWKGASTIQNRKAFMEGPLPWASLHFWAYGLRLFCYDPQMRGGLLMQTYITKKLP
jgi:hypothetical protein